MNWLDWLIIGILLFSTFIGLYRGFSREALSLVTLVFAVWLSLQYSPVAGAYLESSITSDSLRNIIAFGLVFVLGLVIGAVVSSIIGKIINVSGLWGFDKILGVIFGFARGVLIVVVLLVGLNVVGVSAQPVWHQSLLVPYFNQLVTKIAELIPEFIEKEKTEIPISLPKQLLPN